MMHQGPPAGDGRVIGKVPTDTVKDLHHRFLNLLRGERIEPSALPRAFHPGMSILCRISRKIAPSRNNHLCFFYTLENPQTRYLRVITVVVIFAWE